TTTATSHHTGGLPVSAQIAVGVVIPVVVILLVGGLWFFVFRRPSQDYDGRGHRRWGTSGTVSSWFVTSSRDPTPPPAYDKSGLDAVVIGLPPSHNNEPPPQQHHHHHHHHQQYAATPDAERG